MPPVIHLFRHKSLKQVHNYSIHILHTPASCCCSGAAADSPDILGCRLSVFTFLSFAFSHIQKSLNSICSWMNVYKENCLLKLTHSCTLSCLDRFYQMNFQKQTKFVKCGHFCQCNICVLEFFRRT